MTGTAKSIASLIIIATAILTSSCTGADSSTKTGSIQPTTAERTTISGSDIQTDYYLSLLSNFDKRTSYDSDAVRITLNGDGCDISGDGALFENGTLSITAGGDYVMTGILTNGSVMINAPDEKVHIVLDKVSITSVGEAAIYVEAADKVLITLADGSENYINDKFRTVGASAHKACIYARDDLTINGNGKLNVTGSAKNGITCKNDLRIIGAELKVAAINNAIKADDSIIISDSMISVTADGDGIKVSDDEPNDEGYIYISGSSCTLVTGDDGLQADRLVVIPSGTVTVHAEGKAVNAPFKQISDGCIITK